MVLKSPNAVIMINRNITSPICDPGVQATIRRKADE